MSVSSSFPALIRCIGTSEAKTGPYFLISVFLLLLIVSVCTLRAIGYEMYSCFLRLTPFFSYVVAFDGVCFFLEVLDEISFLFPNS
jgi:hypothetical protein